MARKIVYMESMESTYISKTEGGAMVAQTSGLQIHIMLVATYVIYMITLKIVYLPQWIYS